MKNKSKSKKIKKPKNGRQKSLLFIVILASVLLVFVAVYAFVFNDNKKYYECYSYEDINSPLARCITVPGVPEKEELSCYGYFDLKGQKIEEGIKVEGRSESTCEGLFQTTVYYFNKQGDFISKSQQTPPNSEPELEDYSEGPAE